MQKRHAPKFAGYPPVPWSFVGIFNMIRRAVLARASEPTLRDSGGDFIGYGLRRCEPRTDPSVKVHVFERGDIDRPGGRRFGTLVDVLLDLGSATDVLKATAVGMSQTCHTRTFRCGIATAISVSHRCEIA
jgi:hypothetical protein